MGATGEGDALALHGRLQGHVGVGEARPLHQGGIVDLGQGVVDGLEVLDVSLAAGTAVIEVYEFSNITPDPTPAGRTCLSVELTRL